MGKEYNLIGCGWIAIQDFGTESGESGRLPDGLGKQFNGSSGSVSLKNSKKNLKKCFLLH